MRALIAVLAATFLALIAPAGAKAESWLDQPFDPARMSPEDIATVQAALAFSTDYFGFLTGIWDEETQEAFRAYAAREANRTTPRFRDLERLVMALEDERVRGNWHLYHDERSQTHYLHPFGVIEQLAKDSGPDRLEFLSGDGGFSMVVRYEDLDGVKSSHDWFRQKPAPDTETFERSDDRVWITSVVLDDEYFAYARSDLTPKGEWVTLSIVVTPEYFPHLNLLASSVTPGTSPASLIWTKGGIIDSVINGDAARKIPPEAVIEGPKDQIRRGATTNPKREEAPPVPPPSDWMPPAGRPSDSPAPGDMTDAGPMPDTPPATSNKTAENTPPQPAGNGAGLGGTGPAPGTSQPVAEAPKPKLRGTIMSSGSGFYFDQTRLLTAAHVIEGCSAVAMIDGTPLEVLAADSALDLAVLGGAVPSDSWLKLSALDVPKLGEAISVLGYPYYGSMDQGLTITSGNVSALRGLEGNSDRVMVTAPVQPGNSGGPLLNRKGAIIGVVVSRMDDMKVLEETGSLPQNMNFAVPTGALIRFLAQNNITRPQNGGASADLSGELPEEIGKTVVPLHCYR